MLKKTKTGDTLDALGCTGVRYQSYPYYWSSKWPLASCETAVCRAGVFCVILALEVVMAPRRLVHDGSLCCGVTESHGRVPCRDIKPRVGKRKHHLKAGE